eukprot:XP_015132942.1 uncharacterized protein LOC107051923 [Gallus gallus]
MVDDSFLLVPMTLFFLYVLFLVARVSLLITIWFLQAGRRLLRLRRWWRRGGTAAPETGAESQTRDPRCSCPSCNRCSKADQELQQLVLLALAEHVATPGPDFWKAAWRDLEELVERGSLSCCSSANAQSTTRRNVNVHQGASAEQVPVCAPRHVRTGKAHTHCKTQARCMQSFLRRGQGSSLHHQRDATVAKPGCFRRQDLMATKPAQAKNEGGKAGSRAAADPTEVCFSSRPPAEDCIVRENIFLPGGRLPQRPDNLMPLPEWAMYPPGLPCSARESPERVATSPERQVGKPVPPSDQEQRLWVPREQGQHKTKMGCSKERRRADQLHAGTCSYILQPEMGTIAHDSIMQVDEAIRWWEQKEQQPVGLHMHPPEVPRMHSTVRPAAAPPSRLATEDDCRTAAGQHLSCPPPPRAERRIADQAGRQADSE